MNGKVSIIIAVYNKAPYLDTVFSSVSKQIYRNLEVIIVNDGSTDNSIDIIRKWENVFIADGFDVIVVEQENGGVAAAIKTGLQNATGEYVCFPDADDELLPEYVSLMVESMAHGYDYVFCDIMYRNEVDGTAELILHKADMPSKENVLERYLLGDIPNTLCVYLVQLSYFKEYNIIEKIITDSKISQEPQLIIPMLFYSHNMAPISKSLYIYNTYAQGVGKTHIDDPMNKVLVEYHNVQARVIDMLDATPSDKKRLVDIAKIGNVFHAYSLLKDKTLIYKKALEVLNPLLYCENAYEKIEKSGIDVLQAAVNGKLLKREHKSINISGTIIAFGSLGEVAARLLPFMKDTPLSPAIYFDRAANENPKTYDDKPVIVTDEKLIQKGDTLLCLPKITIVEQYVSELAEKHDATVLNYYDIVDYLAGWYYPEMRKAVTRF